ncbi:cadherin-23-like [Octopus bimaculoides]|uniref:cadherin-23-like n=1 Tax=Octopus bimaculoides TaxID=37653 RepID=UPI0022E4ED24|nr:cadherin-23-like [Octopus bimaculoides]
MTESLVLRTKYKAAILLVFYSIGHDIVILHCFDADSDLYNRIKYRLQTTTPMIPFRVSSAGIVQLSGSLDYDIERSYVFQVLVGDNGLKQTTVVLNIQVTENEANSPIFVSNFSTSIMEDAPIGYFVVDITATSKQHQAIKAGKLIYSIHSGNDAKLFRINSHTGCVTLDGNLDREKQASYVLLIKAVEKSKIQNSAMAALTIVVADVNDNAPSCQPSAFSLTLTEDQKLNTPLQAFFCEDLDEKGNLSLTYSVTSSEPNVFDMKRQILVLKSDFDLAKNPHGYHLYVTVSDSVHELKITGYVKVTAVNKFPPVFAQNHYTVRFPEGTSIGHQLIKISATDRDHPNIGNDIIKYSIVKSGDKLPFHIDKQSGTIFVDSVLDRENIEKYNFQVEAVDESLRTVCDITVIVTDINDNPPYFNPASYSATVSEVDSLGTKVVDVRAYDNDTGSNAIITYSIVGMCKSFSFLFSFSYLRLSYCCIHYILTTEATDLFGGDGALSSTAVVIVQIRPVNEFPPVFQNQAYSVVVQETVTIGSILLQVSATDEDKGNDGQLIYTMPSHQLFSLERTTGQLKLKHSLDFEKTPQFILNVTAIDKGTVAKSATTKVVINVENVNEEGPKCLENFISVSVPENQQIGSSFVSLSCNDSDSGRFGEISFSIMSVNGVMNNGPFAVDNSGNLKLITSLDFEKSEKILIHIAVQDGGIPPKDTIIIISVQIIDINEAAPVFEDFNTTITIPESVSIGTVISRISASDVDIKDCITYHLTQTSEKFQLDSITGDLEVKSNLDFETKNIYLLPLKAVDSGQNPKPRTSEITLTVILTDINDSPPVFSQNLYTKTIREDTPIDSVLVTLTVSDNDSSENAIANFTVIGDTKNFFRASRDSSGNCNIILTSLEGADYEQNTSRVFKVKATDTGGLSSETTVIFQIQPLNEHAPVILNRARTLTVDENCTAGSQLTVVNAIDPDKGKDGQIHYRLVKDFAKFTIASKSGEIIIQNELDREEREFYQLEVIAIDEGQDPSAFSTTLTLSIHVNDVNDNRPSCQQEHYFVQIREDEPVGTEVLHLVCSDNDKDPAKKNNVLTYAITSGNERMAFSMNSSSGLLSTVTSLDRESVSSYELSIQVSDKGSSPLSVDLVLQIRIEGSIFYSILSGNIKNQFMLDSVSGELRLLIGLDREDISSYDLLIQASDKGFPPLKTLCHVTFTVLDINDNAPICTSSYIKVILAENKPLASVVTNVECNDEDSGSNAIVSYKIISGNHENSFAIDGQTGMITVKKNLDAERNQSLLLGIEASDGFYKSEVRVDISISDINETPPQFQPPGPYKVSISEDSAIGSTVFQVTAIDEDVTSTSVLYSLSTTQNSVFIIDRKTGIIQLNSRLDRDTKSLYILQVEASDNSPRQPLSQTVDVSVVVTDVNDNYPQCFPPFLFSLLETTPFPLDISQLNCQDKDPSSPELSYRIENANEAEMFRIDEKTGLVQLVKALDYERAKIHILRVNVSDNGVPRLLTKVLITIEVRPVNDNAPTFSPFFVRRVSVEENVPLGISLLKVNVKDADVGEDHGLVSLSIEAGDQYGNFYIDSKSGSLSLIRYLDRETKAIFNLTIIARDCIHDIGVPLTSTTTLIVSVMDVNDNYPQFSQNSFLLKVNENAKPGSKLLTFQVQDEDTGLRGKTTLAIVEGNEKNIFSIINSHLLLHRNLDYETKPFFRLKIKASDRGSEPLSSFCHVNIEVIPRNEFSPAFLEKNSSLVLRETVPVGTIVCKVNVSDKDGSLNGVLNFSIISSTPLNAPISAFELDQKSGEISLVSKLDFETMPDIFNLVVKATDQAESDDTPFSSTLILSVTILNENDNPPIFTQNSFSFEVRENSPLGIYIDQITARDMDSGSFGKINYTIVDNTHDFGIDPLDGKLYLNSTLDYEQKQLYFLTVEVRDEGFPSLSATCLVKIAVIDVNDNAPAFPLSEQSVTVIEDVAQDTVIFKLHSSDADSFKSGNNQVQYKLFESFPSRNYFSIDAFSGEIHIKQRLDRETIPRHKLIILAVDQGSPQLSGTTTLTVIVEDVNDNSPVIKGDYKRRIPEDTLPGSLAFKISAFDADIGINAALSFEIVDGNTNSDFEIDKSSGYLFVNNTLDREQRSTYRLRISVTDQGLEVQRQGFNTVEIIVTDINDNTPVFLNNSYTFTISENLPKMTPVGKIDAVDADEGSNAALKFRIFYMLQGPGDFVMDSGSGIISTKKELDRELVPIYRLWCEVSDSGTPSLSAFTEVRIVVLDENDNEPIFDKTSYSVRILENTPVGSTAMELNIIDLDINKAGKITLHFSLNSNDLDAAKYYFEIVYQPPRLVLRRSIDREKLDNFDFILTAQDGGVPSLSSEASVSVHIDDVNDNRPHFSPVFFNQEASRDISCEKVLTRVSAVDQDLGDNGRISYYFVQNKYNYVFEINDVSGEIKMQMKGWKNKYIMIIKAKDWGIPQLVSDNSATLRLDTFNPSEALVSIYLDISLDDFNLKKKLFTNLLTSLIQVVYPTGKFKIWCVQEIEPVTGQAITAKRRLTADER